MPITAEDIERFTVRQDANNFLRELRRLDQSTPRGPNEKSRVQTLREAVAKQMGLAPEDDGELTREPAKSKSASGSKLAFVFQKGNNGGPLRVESDAPELEGLRGRALYVLDEDGAALAVAMCE